VSTSATKIDCRLPQCGPEVASAVVTRRNDSIPSTWNGPRLANTNTNLPLCLSNLRTAPITTDDDFKGPSTPQLLVTVSTYGSGPESVVRVSAPGTLSSREPAQPLMETGSGAPARYSVRTKRLPLLLYVPSAGDPEKGGGCCTSSR
jgi:hypothetical protein